MLHTYILKYSGKILPCMSENLSMITVSVALGYPSLGHLSDDGLHLAKLQVKGRGIVCFFSIFIFNMFTSVNIGVEE